MNETNILHALKDAATEINDLSARVRALEKRIEIDAGLMDEVCNCQNCDGSCNEVCI